MSAVGSTAPAPAVTSVVVITSVMTCPLSSVVTTSRVATTVCVFVGIPPQESPSEQQENVVLCGPNSRQNRS